MRRMCAACDFYSEKDGRSPDETPEDGLGECRRYAPRPLLPDSINGSDVVTEWEWPIVLGSHWCGEFLPVMWAK